MNLLDILRAAWWYALLFGAVLAGIAMVTSILCVVSAFVDAGVDVYVQEFLQPLIDWLVDNVK